MTDLETLIAELDTQSDEDFEKRLADALKKSDRAWIESQILEHVLHERHLHSCKHRELGRKEAHVESVPERKSRLVRIRKMGWDAAGIKAAKTLPLALADA